MAVPLTQLARKRTTASPSRAVGTVAFTSVTSETPTFPPARLVSATSVEIANGAASFVGRARELAALRRLLDERRLLTLTGIGGIGKSRLARQLATERADRDTSVWIVDLAVLGEPVLLLTTIETAVGLNQAIRGEHLDRLIAIFNARPTLLVLDGCEQVLDACAALAGELLAACPGLRLLATSREPLVAPGELAWPVPPLALAAPNGDRLLDDSTSRATPSQSGFSEAIHLFIERVAALRPDVATTDLDIVTIDDICRQLAGLPLAIELAAAQVRCRALPLIAHELAKLTRQGTATTGAAVARLRILRGAVAWAVEQLEPADRALLRRLACFSDSFSAEAIAFMAGREGSNGSDTAEAVSPATVFSTSSPLAMLDHLIAIGVVIAEPQCVDIRYRLPRAVRAHLLERGRAAAPDQDTTIQADYVAFALALVEEESPRLYGPARAAALDRLAWERANFRGALSISLGSDLPSRRDDGLRLAAGLWWSWFHQGAWAEGRFWLERALNDRDWSPADNGAVPLAHATALCGAGWLAFARGDHAVANQHLTASVAAFRQHRDLRGLVLAGGLLSQVLLAVGELAAARRLAGETVALALGRGHAWDLALARLQLGHIERLRGNDAAANRLFEESIEAARSAGDRWLEAMGLHHLGVIAARNGRANRGRALLRESLSLSYQLGASWFLSYTLAALGGLVAIDGDPRSAARLLGAADGLRATGQAPTYPLHQIRGDLAEDSERRLRSSDATAAYWTAGRAMSLAEAVAFALDEPSALSARPPARHVEPSATATVRELAPRLIRVRAGESMEREQPAKNPYLHVNGFGLGRIELQGRLIANDDWTYAKPRELLFYLLDHPDRSKEQVGAALWPGTSAEQVRGSFHVALHHLRRVLGDAGWVRFADRRYTIDRSRSIVYDVAAFEACLTAARRIGDDRDRRIAKLEEALPLYTAGYLTNLAGLWIEARRDALRRAYLNVLLCLGKEYLANGRPREAEEAFRRLIDNDAWHEAGHRGLMRALARQGQSSRALSQIDDFTERRRMDGKTDAIQPETTALVTALRQGQAI